MPRISTWQLRSRAKADGFTMVELLVVAAIMGLIMGSLVMALRMGDLSVDINSERLELNSKVRMLSGWIVRDVRQAVTWDIILDNPASSHLKFRTWTWNTTSNARDFSNASIEYEYDSVDDVLIRRYYDDDGAVVSELEYSNITMSPFYTSYTSESVNAFDNATLHTDGQLIVVVKAESQVRGRSLQQTMVEEVKLRNE